MHAAFELSSFGDEPLPLVLTPRRSLAHAEFLDLLRSEHAALHGQLLQHGGVLLRGWPVADAHQFAAAVEALGLGHAVDYIGGDSPREKLAASVYSSTEAPAGLKIPLHNELSFVRDYPRHIYFFCEQPPSARGETILGDARRIYRALDPELRARFADKQLRYISAYHGRSPVMELVNHFQRSHKSWHEVFETRERAQVERLCRANDFDFTWRSGGWISVSQTRPAAITHPESGDWVWFSQPHLYDFNPRLLGSWRFVAAKLFYARPHTRLHEVSFGDGTPIERRDLYQIMDTLDANTIAFPWQRGDLLVLDNVLTMHGRAAFAGPRRILASMTRPHAA